MTYGSNRSRTLQHVRRVRFHRVSGVGLATASPAGLSRPANHIDGQMPAISHNAAAGVIQKAGPWRCSFPENYLKSRIQIATLRRIPPLGHGAANQTIHSRLTFFHGFQLRPAWADPSPPWGSSSMHTRIAVLLFAAIALAQSTTASAQPITVPAGLHPGDQYRLAFVSSETTQATSTNITVYNNFVNRYANLVPQLRRSRPCGQP